MDRCPAAGVGTGPAKAGASFRTIIQSLMSAVQELEEAHTEAADDLETTFAPDSSGFCTSRFVRWFDVKYGITREQADEFSLGSHKKALAAIAASAVRPLSIASLIKLCGRP